MESLTSKLKRTDVESQFHVKLPTVHSIEASLMDGCRNPSEIPFEFLVRGLKASSEDTMSSEAYF